MASQAASFAKPSQVTLETSIRRLKVNTIKLILKSVVRLSGTGGRYSGLRKEPLVAALAQEIIKVFEQQIRASYESALVSLSRGLDFSRYTQYIWRDNAAYRFPAIPMVTAGSQNAPPSSAAPHGPNCTCGNRQQTQRAPATAAGPSSSSFASLQFANSGYITPLVRISDPVIFNDTRGRVSTASVAFRLSVDQADMADHSRRAGNEEYRVFWYMCNYADACNYLRQNPKRPVFAGYPYDYTMYLNSQQLSPEVIKSRKPHYPIDITSLSKMSSDETNQLSINYRNSGMHVGMVMLAKVHTPASIIKEIRTKNPVSADEVRRTFFNGSGPGNEDDDDDLISTGSLVSLKCPLGLMRITTPTRSKYCQHPQCFDCETFLQMKHQVPSTKCPVCSLEIKSWEELVIDLYFEDILQKTSPSDDRVYIEADGTWKPKQPMDAEDVDAFVANKRLRRNGGSDAIDLSDYSSSDDRQLNRDKRQRTEVIDLTIDSDDYDDYGDYEEGGGEEEYGYESLFYASDDQESYTEDMSFDTSFPPMTQEDIALVNAVEASSQSQNENTDTTGNTVVTPSPAQQITLTTPASRPSHTSVQSSSTSVNRRGSTAARVHSPLTPATSRTPTTPSHPAVSPPAANSVSRPLVTNGVHLPSTPATPRAPAMPGNVAVNPPVANSVSRTAGASGVHANGSARSARSAPTPGTKSPHKKTSRTPISRPRVLDTTTDRAQNASHGTGTLVSPTGVRNSHPTPTRVTTSHYPNMLHQFMTLPPSRSEFAVASFNFPTSPPPARVRESTSNHALSRNSSLPTSPTRVVGMSPAYISLISNHGIPRSNASPTSPRNGQQAPNEARPSA